MSLEAEFSPALPCAMLPSQAPLRVGLLGLGTVGAGTFAVLARNSALVAARAGRPVRITMVAVRNTARATRIVGQGVVLGAVSTRARPRMSAIQARSGSTVLLVNDPFAVVNHPDIDVVVEAIGGTTVAKALVLQAIANHKHVVTANKALLAEHGEEVFAAAQAKGVIVAYEGAVAVSIPIIKTLREGLSANRIAWVVGIVNGTSNFVLSAMRQGGTSFDMALRQAQTLGYAEADPAFDVEGIDAAHKLALLASNAFGVQVKFSDIHVEGITQIDAMDMACAARMGMVVKLLAIATQTRATESDMTKGAIALRVHPVLLPINHLLSQVENSMNAVMVKGDASGVTMYYGAGAGGEQTASAVIADLVDVSRAANLLPTQRVPTLGFAQEAMRNLPVLSMDKVRSRFCLRVRLTQASHADQMTRRDTLVDVLTRHSVVIERNEVIDLEETSNTNRVALLLTQTTQESVLRQAVATWECLGGGVEQVRVLRVGFDSI